MPDANGDGHHIPTDVLRAWLSEANGPLQAVIEVKVGTWVPEHDDPVVVAGYAFIFDHEGQTRYVRMSVDAADGVIFDYGTWSLSPNSTFTQQGLTTGGRDTRPSARPRRGSRSRTRSSIRGKSSRTRSSSPTTGSSAGSPPTSTRRPAVCTRTTTARGPRLRRRLVRVHLHRRPREHQGREDGDDLGEHLSGRAERHVTITRTTVPGAVAVANTMTNASGNYSVQVRVRETTVVQATVNGIESTTRKIPCAPP